MSYEDRMDQLRGELRNRFLVNDTSSSIKNDEIYKDLNLRYVEYVERNWDVLKDSFNSMEEAINYVLLDEIVCFDLNLDKGVSVEDLAKFLKIDSNLLNYCELQVFGDGIIGQIKYKKQITEKKELIKKAFEFCRDSP